MFSIHILTVLQKGSETGIHLYTGQHSKIEHLEYPFECFSDWILNGVLNTVQYSDILSETRIEMDNLSDVWIITFIPRIQQQPNWFKPFKYQTSLVFGSPMYCFFILLRNYYVFMRPSKIIYLVIWSFTLRLNFTQNKLFVKFKIM